MVDKKKLAFTIAETLICMFILSIFVVLSMKVFTKKHQKPVYNAAHGYYMCYRDAKTGNIMKKIGAAAPTGPYPDGCDFQPIKSANFYVLYAVGGGGGGKGNYGGAPGEFTTMFLTSIADTLKIIPGKAGAYQQDGQATYIRNNNPLAGADQNVLVVQGGLKGGESKIKKNYVRSCKAVPLSSLLTNSTGLDRFTNNLADKATCKVEENRFVASLCGHDYEDVYQYDKIYGNSDSFFKTYVKEANQSISTDGLNKLFNDNNYRYVFENNCLIRYNNAFHKTASRSTADKKYCFEGDKDKLYYYTWSHWYLANQNTNQTSLCYEQTYSYSDITINDEKDSEIVVRNKGNFKFLIELYYDLTKKNVTRYIKDSGFGTYLINSGMKDETTAVLFHPEDRVNTAAVEADRFDPSAGDGGHKSGAGYDGAVFIAW